ncbi:hypothetical protein [Isoptericola sp. NPDC058082]|uniref:hypothetical protein n=1 Tax=Isoptericola sp. NPDC058082 TaxID=3346331 RepID=UPI0036EB1048
MRLQGDVVRDTGLEREEATLVVMAALGVMTASVSVAVLGPWAPIVGAVVLALARLGAGRPTAAEGSRMVRAALTGALVGWAAMAAFMGAALMVPTDVD